MAMRDFVFSIVLFSFWFSTAFAITPHDTSIQSFSGKSEFYTEEMDFSGIYPHLENINIDATRKKRVELNLSGSYPVLKTVFYRGSFGTLAVNACGDLPVLENASFLCSSCHLLLDLSGQWSKSASITVKNENEDIRLIFPADIGVIVRTTTGLKGKVSSAMGFRKVSGSWNKKMFVNDKYPDASVRLTVDIVTCGKGSIFLAQK
ncbi:MAG: hypothetical protein RRZ67_02475 [Victivallaceae bacterium]